MGILGSVPLKRRPRSVSGVFLESPRRGQLRAQSYPKHRRKWRDSYEQAIQDRFKELVAASKRVSAREQNDLRAALERHASTHRGQQGVANIRQRDLLVQLLSGRLIALQAPDGTKIWPLAALQEISDAMDWAEPRVGSLLVRGPDRWKPTMNCKAASVLTLGPDYPIEGCCPRSDYFYIDPEPPPNFPVGQPVFPSIFDTFTGANGTWLQNHVSDSGHNWAYLPWPGHSNRRFELSNGAARMVQSGVTGYYLQAQTFDPGAMRVQSRITNDPTSGCQVVLNLNPSNGHAIAFRVGGRDLDIYKVSSGGSTFTLIYTADDVFTTENAEFDLEVLRQGDQFQAWENGNIVLDQEIAVPSPGTLGLYAGIRTGNVTDIRWHDFYVVAP